MNLKFKEYVDLYRDRYHSKSQLIRAGTEAWAKKNLYCPICGAVYLIDLPNNSPVADFRCDECEEQYQVKAKKKTLGRSVTDGEFNKMQEAINKCKIPNFFFINYLPDYSCITNLVLVPKEFILPDVIVPRRPLGPTARRASWQGCNIRIDRIPDAGKVFVVRDSQAIAKEEVLNNVKKISFFRQTQDMKQRNWLSDVLLVVSWIKSPEFRLVDVYQFAPVLQARHPGNHHIKDKIRQQLQVLRNCGMLEFTSRGKYRKL